MAKMIGYMITWTTYGSWLQGNGRGYVKMGKILEGNEALRKANLENLKSDVVKLTDNQQKIVREAILHKAESLSQKIFAIAVHSNHVHIVAGNASEYIEKVVSYYKNASRLALKNKGFRGRVWTRGFDKRFCYDEQQLQRKIGYVHAHQKLHD